MKQKSEPRKDGKSKPPVFVHYHDRRSHEERRRRAEEYADLNELDNERLPRR